MSAHPANILPSLSVPAGAPRPDKELLKAWLLLLIEGGTSYGYDMRRGLAARQVAIDPGSVYRALRQLHSDGHVQSRWGKTVAGPRRRLYTVTPAGRQHLDDAATRITAIRDSHDAFLRAHAQTLRQRDDVDDPSALAALDAQH